jgi:hypothetical protein
MLPQGSVTWATQCMMIRPGSLARNVSSKFATPEVIWARQDRMVYSSATHEMPSAPQTRYTKSGDLHIAYQVSGEGPLDLGLPWASSLTLSTNGNIRSPTAFLNG